MTVTIRILDHLGNLAYETSGEGMTFVRGLQETPYGNSESEDVMPYVGDITVFMDAPPGRDGEVRQLHTGESVESGEGAG